MAKTKIHDRRPVLSGADKKILRCAIYTRVSTFDQSRKDYSSLDTQRDVCRKLLELKKMTDGWVEVGVYADTKSGETLDRPQLQAMMEDIRQGRIDVVVVYKLDRLSRSVADFCTFWEFLRDHSADFASATETFDTATSGGRFFLNMMMVFAEFERERIKERTAESRQQRAEKGEWGGGIDAFGYRNVEGKLVPDEHESQVVHRMFTDISSNVPSSDVARWLRAEGIKTRSRIQNGKTVGGKWFTTDSVKAVIRNVAHKGCIMHNGHVFPGEHRAIVSDDLWERANRVIAPRVDRRPSRIEEDKHGHLLKGILVCGHCGKSLTPHPAGKKDANGQPYLYYACTNVTKEGAKSECGVRSIPAKRIEELVVSLLGEMGKHPETIEKTVGVLRRSAQKEIGPIKAEIEAVTKQIRALQEQETRLAAIAANPATGDFGANLIREGRQLAERRKSLEQDRDRLRVQVSVKEVGLIDAHAVSQQLLAFRSLIDGMAAEEQKELVRLLLREIRVNRFDPEKQKAELGDAQIPLNIRTQWFVLNITFFANDLFSRILQTGVKQFVSHQNWLPGLGSNQRPSD